MEQERQWIRQIKNNSSKSAAHHLISRYYNEIYAYVFKQTLNQELSMDLTQEIFISVLRSIEHFDESKASFRTWLYKLSTNRIIDYYRSRAYKTNRLTLSMEQLDTELADPPDFIESLEEREDVERILELVGQFDASAQQLFRLKVFAGYSFREISELVTGPESTVKTRYYSMIRSIKRQFEEDERASERSKAPASK